MRPGYESRLLGVERMLGILAGRAGALERSTWEGLQEARQLEQEVPPAAPVGCPGGSSAFLAFTVHGCNGSVVSGVTVTATKGAFTATGTTSAGAVTLDVSAGGAGTYSWTVDGTAVRLSTTTGTAAVTCGATATVATQTLTAIAGYACYSACAIPLPTTLYHHSSFGVATLTYNGSFWTGTLAINPTGGTVKSNCTGTGCGAARTAGGTTTATFNFGGGGNGGHYKSCVQITSNFPVDDSAGTTCTSSTFSQTLTSQTCPMAFLWTGHYLDGAGFLVGNLAVTVSETP